MIERMDFGNPINRTLTSTSQRDLCDAACYVRNGDTCSWYYCLAAWVETEECYQGEWNEWSEYAYQHL